MAILSGNQSNSPTVQAIASQLKADPSFYKRSGGAAGWSTEPMLTIANEILSRMLAENMPWIWNRSLIPPFLTVSLQQDYCTQLTDVGWLEAAWRIDINNSTSNNNGAPKPVFALETVRYTPQVSTQSVPFNISFVSNSEAFLGSWQPNHFLWLWVWFTDDPWHPYSAIHGCERKYPLHRFNESRVVH